MTIQEKILTYLTKTYGKPLYSETTEGNTMYEFHFDYMSNPAVLTVAYLKKAAKVTVTISFVGDYYSLVDIDKGQKILMYLDVFYAEPRVELIEGKLTLQTDYTFTSAPFVIDDFSSRLDLIEHMAIEVNDILEADDFYDDAYQDALYSGNIYEERLKDQTHPDE